MQKGQGNLVLVLCRGGEGVVNNSLIYISEFYKNLRPLARRSNFRLSMWTAKLEIPRTMLPYHQPTSRVTRLQPPRNSVCKNFFPENQGEFGSLKQEPACSFCMILAINLALLQILKFLFVWPHCASGTQMGSDKCHEN